MDKSEGARPWWRRLLAALAPARPEGPERLAQHYEAEVRLAEALERDAGRLDRYPNAQARVREGARRARERAERLRRALEKSGHPVAEPGAAGGAEFPTTWDALRASVSELDRLGEMYLADAYALEHDSPDIATLLHALHRQAVAEHRDLIWTLMQVPRIAPESTPPLAA